MKDKIEFYEILERVSNRLYKEYHQLVGDFDFSRFFLKVNEPAAEGEATLFVLRVSQQTAGFPPFTYNSPVRRTALEDFLSRSLADAVDGLASFSADGIARRNIGVARPGQQILPRTSMAVTEEYVEARIYVILPVRQDRINGELAKQIFFEDLPTIVNASLIFCNLDSTQVDRVVDVMEDADQVRQLLSTQGLVGFVSDSAMINRAGSSDLPDVQYQRELGVPEELLREVDVPNTDSVRGIGIPSGLTVIIGDDFSGRSPLMRALAMGIYNHVAGDGREFVITVPDAVYVAAERGRSAQRVDVSQFISSLPQGEDVTAYSTDFADPFLSQVTSTVEMLEVGARVLLYDESDSASSFLSRDVRFDDTMGESNIKPLASVARNLVDDLGVSVVVAGYNSISEFVPIADTVFQIKDYQIREVTAQVKELGVEGLVGQDDDNSVMPLAERARWIVPSSIDPSSGREDVVIESLTDSKMQFGRTVIDLSSVHQISDPHQAKTIAVIMAYVKDHYLEEARPMHEILDLIDRDLSTEGLDCLTQELSGEHARPRRYEVAGAFNRLRTLRIGFAGE